MVSSVQYGTIWSSNQWTNETENWAECGLHMRKQIVPPDHLLVFLKKKGFCFKQLNSCGLDPWPLSTWDAFISRSNKLRRVVSFCLNRKDHCVFIKEKLSAAVYNNVKFDSRLKVLFPVHDYTFESCDTQSSGCTRFELVNVKVV